MKGFCDLESLNSLAVVQNNCSLKFSTEPRPSNQSGNAKARGGGF